MLTFVFLFVGIFVVNVRVIMRWGVKDKLADLCRFEMEVANTHNTNSHFAVNLSPR